MQIEPPRAAVLAPVAVVQAPQSIGPCDGITATAEASYGTLGRTLSFQWQLVGMEGVGVLATDVQQVQTYLDGPTGRLSRVTLPHAATSQASNVTLRVTVANFLSESTGISTVIIRRSAENVPRISMVGGELVQGSALRPLTLQIRVQASPCVDASVEQEPVRWIMTDVVPTDGVSDGSLPGRLLSEQELSVFRR